MYYRLFYFFTNKLSFILYSNYFKDLFEFKYVYTDLYNFKKLILISNSIF